MGFGLIDPKYKTAPASQGGVSVELLHRAECSACPLNELSGNTKMPPSGAREPDVYMLGAAPDAGDIKADRQFSSHVGSVVRLRVPSKWLERIRWNNVIRDRPRGDQPGFAEIECCRPSIERDIARTEPLAVFGFGNVPLKWAIKESRADQWNGRRVPVLIGGYPAWFFPMLDPAKILERRRFDVSSARRYGSEDEFAFAMDMRKAFKAVDAGLPKPIVHTVEMARKGIEVINGSNGEEDLQRIISVLSEMARSEKDKGFDYETDRLRPYGKGARILTAGASTEDDTIAFPLDHDDAGWNSRQRRELDDAWHGFLCSKRGRKIAHALSFEMEWSAEFFDRELLYDGRWEDTQAQAFILDERQEACLSLAFLTLQYFGLDVKELSNVNRKNMAAEPLSAILPYQGLDAKYCRLLFAEQRERLREDDLQRVYEHHLLRIPATVLTQRKGIPIKQEIVQAVSKKWQGIRNKAEDTILESEEAEDFYKRFGEEFNVGSQPHVIKMFADIIGKPLPQSVKNDNKKKSRSDGENSIDATAKALNSIKHRLAPLIVDWRSAHKVYSTYCKPILEGADHLFGGHRVHPILSTMKTRTWRTASEDPNSQNFPKYKDGEEVREAIQQEGHKIVSFDFGGIQARNVAMESKDKSLTKSFWDRYDIHSDWLDRMARIYPPLFPAKKMKENRKLWRQESKNKFVFPSFFGAKPKSIARALNDALHSDVSEEKVTKMQDEFWGAFPQIKDWHEAIEKFYRENGYVTGHSEFRRRAPVALNQLINAPIQADESIIVLAAMADLSRRAIQEEEWYLQPNMEIHDDLTFLWPAKKIDHLAEIVLQEMTKVRFDWINVPLLVEMSVGDHWRKMEACGDFSSDTWDGKFKQVKKEA